MGEAPAPVPTSTPIPNGSRQANYLGHFALTTRLLPLLTRTAPERSGLGRVVHLTSGAHRGAPPEGVPLSLASINDARLGGYARYGMAKLANLAFATELARRQGGELLSSAVHPGVVASDMLRRGNFEAMLGRRLGGLAWQLAQARNALFAYSTEQAALTILFPAVAPELAGWADAPGRNGRLFVPVATPWEPRHPMATDEAFGAALWGFSECVVAGRAHDCNRSAT
mmetsp:Transcript_14943/g.48064  ORF Transcript_14943/g.48064 Transcript_14943/m.48064 type:complete len:227 (+) Transcript_14943:748-1428(+)